jgi:hypothetical protein
LSPAFFQGDLIVKTINQITAIALAALLAGIQPRTVQGAGPEFDFSASAGYQYDSNVNLSEIDENTGEADNALLLAAGANAMLPISKILSFRLGYDYAQTSYREFTDYDTAIHHGMAELSLNLAGFDTAVTLDHFDARVDSEGFLDITQLTPSIARLFADSFYLRGAFTRADKSYATDAIRNARNDAYRADAYVLFDGMKRYLSIGYRIDSEDAVSGDLDYDGNRSMLAYGHRVELGSLELGLRGSVQLENRNYLNVTESIGSLRRDKRLRAGISAELQVSEHFGIDGEIEYSDNQSNLDSANFDENVYALNLTLEF